MLIKSDFYVNYLIISITNTKYKIFMDANGAYPANNSISLFLFVVFVSILFLLCQFNLIFFGLVIFSWSCFNFLLQGELIIILDFSLRQFVRLTNLGTFKWKQLLCYGSSFLHQSSKSIAPNKLGEVPKLALNRKLFYYQYLL